MHAEQAALLADSDASMYAVEGDEAAWSAALQTAGTVPSMISVKAGKGKSKRQLEQESFAAGDILGANRKLGLLTFFQQRAKEKQAICQRKEGNRKTLAKSTKRASIRK
jgi:hypothetical protein